MWRRVWKSVLRGSVGGGVEKCVGTWESKGR